MRIIAFSAICMLMLPLATANDGFDALLKKIDFGHNEPSKMEQAPQQVKLQRMASAKQNQLVAHQTPGVTKPVSFNVGCADGGCADGGCASGNCGGRCGHEDGYCTPHSTPNLPTSTLRQYWKSNACNANVWDGYQNTCKPRLFSKLAGLGRGCSSCGTAGCGGNCDSSTPCDTAVQAIKPVTSVPQSCDAGACDRVAKPKLFHMQKPSCDGGSCDAPVMNQYAVPAPPKYDYSRMVAQEAQQMLMMPTACDGGGCDTGACDTGSCDR